MIGAPMVNGEHTVTSEIKRHCRASFFYLQCLPLVVESWESTEKVALKHISLEKMETAQLTRFASLGRKIVGVGLNYR